MDLKKSVFTVSSLTMVSRAFGFIRDILIANFLGAGLVADAFFVAFRFPNLFRRLFAEGAFSAAFVPIFSEIHANETASKAREFVEQVFSMLSLILIGFLSVFEIIMPWAMFVIAPGFSETPGKFELAIELSRITFPYLFFISLVSLQSGVLNSLGRFGAAAAAPILLNIVLITSLLVFGSQQLQMGYILSVAVTLAGLVQFIWLSYHCRKSGFPIRIKIPRLTKKIKNLGTRILPVVFGASLYQLNLLIGTILASLVSDGAVSYLYYADRVTQLPLGVIGVAVGTALLPMLSRQLSMSQEKLAIETQNRGLEISLFFSIPAAVGLVVIPLPIVMVLFERGAFTHEASIATSYAITAFSIGLPAYVLIKVLAPGFFAREDTSTPVRIAAISMGINIFLNLCFMHLWGHVGIALASSVSAWVNAIFLAVALHKRGNLVFDQRLKEAVLKIVFASFIMGVSVYFGSIFFSFNLYSGILERILFLVIFILGGIIIFGFVVVILKVMSLQDLRLFLKR